jgi:tartrate dehydrogenase/decarboxylase / D-malate dehydrogenase
MHRTFNIAVIEGDGIGPEVTQAAMWAADEAAWLCNAKFDWTPYPWGTDFYFEHGKMADDDFLDRLAKHDAILLGAVGHPDVQDHITLNGLLLPIRRRFDQYVCLRPAFLYPGVESPLRDKAPGSIDIQVFRENVEGEYANIGGRLYQHQPADIAVQTSVFTRRGCERIIQAAFELAETRPDKRITSITKSNAQGFGMVLWDEVFAAIAADFPDVETESLLIDAAVMEFIRRPESFDVVVASNLFGDILTDLAAIVVGSMGLAPSGSIDPTRVYPSMFEPVHGSAPDITGKGIANPLAAILSAAMMLDHLELPESATAMRKAVANLLASDGPRTTDIGGSATTAEVSAAIVELISRA